MIDLFFRAFSRARWLTVATNRGVYDTEGNINPGFGIDELGNVMVTPPVINPDGTVQTPAVIDTWHCVNLRLYGPQAEADDDDPYEDDSAEPRRWKFLRSKLARFVREQATVVMVRGIRAYQFGTAANRFQLLDPRDIPVPPRVWAGGMEL